MDNITRIAKLAENKYQSLFGVHKSTFDAMLAILNRAYEEMRKKGGRKRKLSVLDMLVITLQYYREYRTMEHIGFDYGTCKQRVCEAIVWVENTLITSGAFALPDKRWAENADATLTIAVIDATEQETERPKKTRGLLFRKTTLSHN
jgi:hypothetical protein